MVWKKTIIVNAMLSFAYAMLAGLCTSALEGVGLDSYVGLMHTDRSGRNSLSLDLMEEFRTPIADRFVLKLINNRIMKASDFQYMENGAVLMTDDGRSRFLQEWQAMKNEELQHPFLEEKIVWGQLPWTQALILSRTIRGEMDEYAPFIWRP